MSSPPTRRGPPEWVVKFFEAVDSDGTRGAFLRTAWSRLPSLCPPDAGNGPERSFREVIALQSIVVVQVAGLLAFIQRQPEAELRVAMTYLGLFTVPILGLVAVIWFHQASDGQRQFVYSRPVRRYGLVALGVSLCIAPTTTYYYWIEGLPGQGKATIVDTRAVSFKNRDDQAVEKKTKLELVVTPNDVKTRPWLVEVKLVGETKKHWKINQINGFLDENFEQKWSAFGRADLDDHPEQSDQEWLCKITTASSGTYWLQLVLSQREGAAKDSRAEIPNTDVAIRTKPQ